MSSTPPSGGESKQTIESVDLAGALKQTSDALKAEQKMKDAKGSEASQTVHGDKQKLVLGKFSASGKWAVVGLVVVAVVYAVFKWLAN